MSRDDDEICWENGQHLDECRPATADDEGEQEDDTGDSDSDKPIDCKPDIVGMSVCDFGGSDDNDNGNGEGGDSSSNNEDDNGGEGDSNNDSNDNGDSGGANDNSGDGDENGWWRLSIRMTHMTRHSCLL